MEPMTEGIFYLKLGGKVEGPYTIGQIYDLWAARKINSQTSFARLEEMDKWLPLAELTLTISPPRPAMPKPPSAEPTPTISSRPRPAPSLRTEQYLPSLPVQTERPARPTKQPRPTVSALLGNVSVSLEFLIGLCMVVGVLLALYFMIILPASPDGAEISQERLFMKQNGVIAGIGLVLLSGLLTVARQIKLVSASSKIEAAYKSERRAP